MPVVSPSLSDQVLEAVPLPLLLLREDGTVSRLNPQALDLLRCSLFAAVDQPLPAVLASLDEPLEARHTELPEGQGTLVTLVRESAPSGPDEQDLTRLEQALHRAADAMPMTAGLAGRELLGALEAMRALRLAAEDRLLDRLSRRPELAGGGQCRTDEALQQVFLSLAPWFRLSGAQVACRQSGEPALAANPGLLGRLLEELLLDAVRRSDPGCALDVSLDNDGRQLSIQVVGGGPVATAGHGRAEQLARLLGGTLTHSDNLLQVTLPVLEVAD